ncbi:hypothetical protein FHG87_020992 [Trinorchestia longiramus]|nr:hypothetical protein FHG87_020992 [Trinorchestia longiramus]
MITSHRLRVSWHSIVQDTETTDQHKRWLHDELSEHGEAQHCNSLESIDSSEDDLEEGENASCQRAIGMTQGAMSVLCQESGGDSRVALRMLQRLMKQATASTASSQPLRPSAELTPLLHQRTHASGDRKMLSSKNHREERRKSESGALRIANYGSKDCKNGRVITYVENDPSLNTDDISSDEENETAHGKPNNSNQAPVKVDDLDNVSDISDSSVNLCRNYGEHNPTAKTNSENVVPKAVNSDESLSSDDILDYEEIEDDFDSETENSNRLSDDLRDKLGSVPSKRSNTAAHSLGRSFDHSSLNMKKERSLLRGSVSNAKVGSVKCKELESMVEDRLVDVKSSNSAAGRTMTVITAKLVRQAFQVS